MIFYLVFFLAYMVPRSWLARVGDIFRDEKLRQQAVTWPAVAVQIPATGNIVVTETPHGRDGGEPLVNLTADYTYHFQGKDYHSTSLAPHRVTVPRKQVYNIKGNFNSREVLYARVNPKQPEESYLSLGKSWFNWWVIVEGLFMVASCPAVCWLFSYLMYPKEGLGFRVVDVLVANPVAYFVSLCFIGIIFLQNDLIRSGSENIPLVKGP